MVSYSSKMVTLPETILNKQFHFIYIVGGDGPTGRLLRYNPQRDVWTILASTRQRREHTGAVAFQGKIVVVGGRFRNRGESLFQFINGPETEG